MAGLTPICRLQHNQSTAHSLLTQTHTLRYAFFTSTSVEVRVTPRMEYRSLALRIWVTSVFCSGVPCVCARVLRVCECTSVHVDTLSAHLLLVCLSLGKRRAQQHTRIHNTHTHHSHKPKHTTTLTGSGVGGGSCCCGVLRCCVLLRMGGTPPCGPFVP